jgi:hypothetical protein
MWNRLWKTWWHLAKALDYQGLQRVGHILISSPLWMISYAFFHRSDAPLIQGFSVDNSVKNPWTVRCKRHA